MNGEYTWLGPPARYPGDPEEGPAVFMPDVEFGKDDATHNYEPMRGYSRCLAVFDLDDKCIGWIKTEVLGHDTVKGWMKATNYVWLRRGR